MDAEVPLRRQLPLPVVKWRKFRALMLMTAVVICGLIFRHTGGTQDESIARSSSSFTAQEDERLQRVAIKALNERDGTVLIIDPQTGRIRAVVNRELAFEKEFAPGSTIKPFAALAAVRSQIIRADSRTLCREKYAHEGFHTVCSHPRNLPPLNPAEAIAYSCNYYFAKLGERMSESQFRATLAEFGFGVKTGVNTAYESSGFLGHDWHPQNVLGDGGYLRVTPLQLMMAYSSLVNGGKLLVPQITSPDQLAPQVRSQIQIRDNEHQIILSGLRGVVRFGTASSAGLDSLPLDVIGKTGTSTPLRGFRTQGWFVGFASPRAGPGPTLGVLVFLTRSHGADAAVVSRSIFEEYARFNETPPRITGGLSSKAEQTQPARSASRNNSTGGTFVRVHSASDNSTIVLPIEEYVLGVVATEGSTETQSEALKALAVASRTFALANLGRHELDGYDFCSSTHCQRFSSGGKVSERFRNAVQETQGEVLRNKEGRLIDSYFSASCGGETANIATLWGARPDPQLQGVVDEYCETMPHGHWTDVISGGDLRKAVRSDPRTDVGSHLRDVFVTRRDETGRAEMVTIVGDRPRTVRGWDFKIIVGRALGWNLLKSSKFQVSHAGSNFVFRGSGFGHGLGLCQEGAHVMGQRGFGYRQILMKYFPGSILARSRGSIQAADLLWSSRPDEPKPTSTRGSSRAPRLRIASEHFRIDYPATTPQADAEYLLQLLETNRSALLRRAYLPVMVRLPFVEVFINETTGDFVGRTGLPAWTAAATKESRIELQPIAVLKRRGVLETTLRHELLHRIVDSVGCGSVPRWLAEGLALYLSGEGPLVSRFAPATRMTAAELESRLERSVTENEMRSLYASAYLEVRRLIKEDGEAEVWRQVRSKCGTSPGRN